MKVDNQLFDLGEFYKSDMKTNCNTHFAMTVLSFLIIVAVVLSPTVNAALFTSIGFAIVCMFSSFAAALCYRQCLLYDQHSDSYFFSESNILLQALAAISFISFTASVGALIGAFSVLLFWLFATASLVSLSLILLFNRQFTNHLRNKM